jgi:hypothetical protein
MLSDDVSYLPRTDDLQLDWWTQIDRLGKAISRASARLGSAMISGACAVAGSNLLLAHEFYGKMTLAASGVFAGWFVLSSGVSAMMRR